MDLPDEPLKRLWRPLFPLRGPHHYQLLRDGGEFIPAMLAAIEKARQCVLLEMYLITSGGTAATFRDALCAAARRQVAVYLCLDGFGGQGLQQSDRVALIEAGAHLAVYNPLGLRRWRNSLARNHRKLLLVDDRVAFVGGMGICDEFDPIEHGEADHWHEVVLAIEGPCVSDWRQLFVQVWQRWSSEPLLVASDPPHPVTLSAAEFRGSLRTFALDNLALGDGALGNGSPDNGTLGNSAPKETSIGCAETALNGSVDGQVLGHYRGGGRAVMRAVLAAIGKAHTRVWIATAYFAPTSRLRRALARAARRGVDVRLLLAGPQNDHPTVWYAGRRFYGRLLRSGVQIYEFQPRFLHAKMVLCDQWATVGSSNLDRWTLHWNLEANQAVTEPDVVADIEQLFVEDFAQSLAWTTDAWHRRGLRLRILERLIGGLANRLVQASYRQSLRRSPPR